MKGNLFNLDEIERESYFIDSKSALKAHNESIEQCGFEKGFIKEILKIIKKMGYISNLYFKGDFSSYVISGKKLLENIREYDFDILVGGRELVIYDESHLIAMRTGGQYEAILFPSTYMDEMRRRVEKNCTQDYIKDLERNIRRAEKYIKERPPKVKGETLDLFG